MLLKMESIEFGHLKHFGHYGDELRFDCYGDPHDLDPEGIGPIKKDPDWEENAQMDVKIERDYLDDTFEENANVGANNVHDFLDGNNYEENPEVSVKIESDFLDDTFEEWCGPGDEEEAAAAALAFFNDIKSDCMWGSSLFGGGRKRDLSLTLTDLFDTHAAAEGHDHGLGDLLGTTPPDVESQIFFGGCHGLMENSQAEEEEAADVKRGPTLVKQVSKLVNSNLPHIEPGRSLLLSSNRPVDKRSPPTTTTHQTFIDHCYFSQTPAKSRTPRGLLTPNETSSSEDDEMIVKSQATKLSATQGIDKKKIVQAVQSLIKKSPNAKPHTVKFRFRMKFKPSESASTAFSNNTDGNSSKHNRRKSALLNPHCPSPLKQSNVNFKAPKNVKSDSKFTDSRLETNVLRGSKAGIELQKIRNHRDLHNSMERQRRIDLRYNFDLLKSAIPDLAINDKASKLNILKQATVYCRRLADLNTQMKQSANQERARNATLKKKFQQLESQFRVRRPTARPLKPRRF